MSPALLCSRDRVLRRALVCFFALPLALIFLAGPAVTSGCSGAPSLLPAMEKDSPALLALGCQLGEVLLAKDDPTFGTLCADVATLAQATLDLQFEPAPSSPAEARNQLCRCVLAVKARRGDAAPATLSTSGRSAVF